jgi:hypothetical protein
MLSVAMIILDPSQKVGCGSVGHAGRNLGRIPFLQTRPFIRPTQISVPN